ncbi:sensor protein ZraS [bacterium BMS3Bbin04]|nr:sensor protein ZraS [bacterium BMS3Bbin04]
MDIPPARAAIKDLSGSMQYTSFLGEPVVGAYVNMLEYDWILVGELDVREALAHVRSIYERTALILILSLLALLVITLVLARSWAQPIVRLTKASEEVAAGNYEAFVTPPRQLDELHLLTISFNRMTRALQTGREMLAHAQRKLIQQEKMAAIGGLVTSIVHEMRNPLSSIKMNLRLLQRNLTADGTATEHLSLASQEAGRLEAMLKELLDYGKPVEPTIVPIALNEFVLAVCTDLADIVQQGNHDLMIVNVEPSPVVLADHELLRRTLENLIRNAIDATDPGGKITLTTFSETKSCVGFVLNDSGHGIKESALERIFDPFFTTHDGGTGLGMSNVKKFVEVMNGDIEIDSTEGEGTEVTVTLMGEID